MQTRRTTIRAALAAFAGLAAQATGIAETWNAAAAGARHGCLSNHELLSITHAPSNSAASLQSYGAAQKGTAWTAHAFWHR